MSMCRSIPILIVCILLHTINASPALANEFEASSAPKTNPPSQTTWMVLSGLGGGGVGFLAGAIMGASYGKKEGRELAGLEEAFYAGSALGAIGLGLGVHLGDKRQGSGLSAILASMATGAAGITLAFQTDRIGILYATVPAQLIVAMLVESKTRDDRSGVTARSNDRSSTRVGLWSADRTSPGLMIRHTF